MNPNVNQRQASDPLSSVWVAASAGTGKTKVLTDRVLSLLLEGAQPEKILCLTFTKAAASEMANRINQKLSSWSVMTQENLRDEIFNLTGQIASPAKLDYAQSLFSMVLDGPTGLRISTIHSFCQTILKKFPIEAGVTPYFSVIDDLESKELIHQSLNLVLESQDPQTLKCLKQVSHHYDEEGFEETLSYLIASRQKLSWLSNCDGAVIKNYLNTLFKVNIDTAVDQFIQLHMNKCADNLMPVAQAMLNGTATDQQKGEAIIRFLTQPEQQILHFDDYRSAFLTRDFEIRKTIATKKVLAVNSEFEEMLSQEAYRLQILSENINALSNATVSYALIIITQNILNHYQNLKTRRAIVDYDDLITLTANLMTNSVIAPWVLFKLDGGIDHILVDEAQDTNDKQWEIVSAITNEFFSGQGARENNRTLFVVGDEKQSIYSFQGANPQIFNKMKNFFAKSVEDSVKAWREVNLGVSFRSTTAVLNLVDNIFANPELSQSISNNISDIKHESFRLGQGGHVEVWPLAVNELKQEVDLWQPVAENPDTYTSPHMILAIKIAQTIKGWLDNKKILPSKGRPIKPSDIMILVQRRSTFSHDLIKTLHDHNVPVCGSDRLLLNDELAIMDLLAAAKFVLQPFDDLNLAVLLKTPLIGICEERLFQLCHNRPQSLWQIMPPDLQQHLQKLKDLYATSTIYGFFTTILNELNGRQLLKSRLGYEIEDPLNEFLELVIDYEAKNTASLSHFVEWFEANKIEIKRDLDQNSHDQVQILTVHGSKGLQAPIIFMPDTTRVPAHKERILWHCDSAANLPLHKAPAGEQDKLSAKLLHESQTALLQEYYRLLYVALTRAEDQLYICGWQGPREIQENCWYNIIKPAVLELGNALATFPEPHWLGEGYVYTNLQLVAVKMPAAPSDDYLPEALPAWFHQPAEPLKITPKINPSQTQLAINSSAVNRGTLIHKLLQLCPLVDPSLRLSYITKYLENNEEKAEIINEVLNVLNEFKLLYGTNSYSEVPISGRLGSYNFSGQIDRLVIEDDKILIIDYKTTAQVPNSPLQIAPHVIKQMLYYKKAIQQMYPGHTVECVILWTKHLKLMTIPDQIMEDL